MKHIKSFQLFESVKLDPILQIYKNVVEKSSLYQNLEIIPASKSFCHAFNFETKHVLTDDDDVGPRTPYGKSYHTGERLKFNCATEDGQVFIACINIGDDGIEVETMYDFINYIGMTFDEKLELWKIAYAEDKSVIESAPEDIAIILTNPKVRPMVDYGIL